LAAFAPNADVLWPGSLVRGESIASGVLTPIALPRGRAYVTVSNIGLPGPGTPIPSLSTSVKQPSLQSVTDAIRTLINNNIGAPVAARIAEETAEYHSIGHAALKMNASASWIGGSLKAGLEK
jgi:hypothetical protein